MSEKKSVIFIGNSGCGKGTQAKLLEDFWKTNGEKVLHLEIGQEFRDFLNTTTYTASVAREIAQRGGLQPIFLAIKMWAKSLSLSYSPDKNLIIDGSPRKLSEAYVLDEALKFYKIEKPVVIYVNVSREVAKQRMLNRGRKDDTEEKIEERLDWFKNEVMKTVEWYKNNPDYQFLEVNGEKSIDEIHRDILEGLNLI